MAIQGEPGYNATITQSNCDAALFGLRTYAAYADGSTRDSMGYESFSMGVASKGAFAISRSGLCGNLFDPSITNLAGTFQQYFYATAPWGKGYGICRIFCLGFALNRYGKPS
jgi:hypothetical protein